MSNFCIVSNFWKGPEHGPQKIDLSVMGKTVYMYSQLSLNGHL